MPQELQSVGGHRLAGVQYSDATGPTPLVAPPAAAMPVPTLCEVCPAEPCVDGGTASQPDVHLDDLRVGFFRL